MVSSRPEQRVTVPLVTMAGWAQQTFVHWPVPAASVRALLPAGLEPDVFDGSAWVSFTPFLLVDVRPLGAVRLPGPHAIPETNLRTYVRGPDGRDGLWFLSAEITHPLVALFARGMLGVPYRLFTARVGAEAGDLVYSGRRGGAGPSYRLRVRPGAVREPSERDVWLTGRWGAYSRRLGVLLRTPVSHAPWALRDAVVEDLEQDLTTAVGLPPTEALPSPVVHCSGGVGDVRFSWSRPAGRQGLRDAGRD
ncbi:MAG TPA: DUF2071 domain-containing protein [Streptomyces sp.]|nr:DUF2071 domain-containing protein [Streptomyces sp.]